MDAVVPARGAFVVVVLVVVGVLGILEGLAAVDRAVGPLPALDGRVNSAGQG